MLRCQSAARPAQLKSVRVDATSRPPSSLPIILQAWAPPEPIAANFPPRPYKQRITVRLGRGRAFIIS